MPDGGSIGRPRILLRGMLARRAQDLRVCIGLPTVSALKDYLGTIRYPDDLVGTVLAEFRDLFEPSSSIVVSLDVGAEVRPRLGLDLSPARTPDGDKAERWDQFASRMISHDLCTEAERQALVSWPGTVPLETAAAGSIRRVVNHVKLLLERDSPPRAKLYFGCFRQASAHAAIPFSDPTANDS